MPDAKHIRWMFNVDGLSTSGARCAHDRPRFLNTGDRERYSNSPSSSLSSICNEKLPSAEGYDGVNPTKSLGCTDPQNVGRTFRKTEPGRLSELAQDDATAAPKVMGRQRVKGPIRTAASDGGR